MGISRLRLFLIGLAVPLLLVGCQWLPFQVRRLPEIEQYRQLIADSRQLQRAGSHRRALDQLWQAAQLRPGAPLAWQLQLEILQPTASESLLKAKFWRLGFERFRQFHLDREMADAEDPWAQLWLSRVGDDQERWDRLKRCYNIRPDSESPALNPWWVRPASAAEWQSYRQMLSALPQSDAVFLARGRFAFECGDLEALQSLLTLATHRHPTIQTELSQLYALARLDLASLRAADERGSALAEVRPTIWSRLFKIRLALAGDKIRLARRFAEEALVRYDLVSEFELLGSSSRWQNEENSMQRSSRASRLRRYLATAVLPQVRLVASRDLYRLESDSARVQCVQRALPWICHIRQARAFERQFWQERDAISLSLLYDRLYQLRPDHLYYPMWSALVVVEAIPWGQRQQLLQALAKKSAVTLLGLLRTMDSAACQQVLIPLLKRGGSLELVVALKIWQERKFDDFLTVPKILALHDDERVRGAWLKLALAQGGEQAAAARQGAQSDTSPYIQEILQQ